MFEQVIRFWFSEIDPSKGWVKDTAFDELIRQRFGALHQSVAAGECASWRITAEGRLAEVIVLDQFSRNLYRDQPESFAYDGQALVLAQTAIELGADLALNETMRAFIYMPLMHSESLMIHDEVRRLFDALGNESSILFAHKHRVIIERFGRYPHRNLILKRTSTSEELAFLQESDSSF